MRKIIISILLIIGLVAAYMIYQNFLSTGPSMANRATAVSIEAQELYRAFEEDENAANQAYLNKVLEVKGRVSNLKQSDTGKYYLELETMGFGIIKCTMEDSFEAEGENLSGKTVTVKGECLGYLLDVQLGECIIIE